jgi:hypothetical protein
MFPHGYQDRAGFTRTDALSVVACSLLLVGIGVTSTAMSRSGARAAQCSASLRQMVRAWQLYSVDHHENFPFNTGVQETEAEISGGTFRNWVNNVMTWDASASAMDRSNTNQQWAVRGGIGPYVDGGARTYRCPADTYLSGPQLKAGWTGRVRSRSMSAFLGPYGITYRDVSSRGLNTFNTAYRQFLRLSDLSQPDHTSVFLDEHPDSINEGYFLNQDTATVWGDLPAGLHDGAGGFVFADGHAEIHRWEGAATQMPVIFSYRQIAMDAAAKADFAWYRAHSPFELAR